MNVSLGGGLSYLRGGAGFPLVFVHGYLGGARMWCSQIEHFSDRFDVIALDLAGFGASAHLQGPDRIETHAEMVLALLDRLGVQSFNLVGHSMGGMIVQHLATSVGERISKLVLYGTGPRGNLPGRFETPTASRRRLMRNGVAATAHHIAATWFVDGENAPDFPFCAEIGASASLQAAIASTHAWERWDGRDALASIGMPTMIVWGEKDRSIGWRQCELLWRGIPGSSLAVCPQSAHNVHFEKRDLFHILIRDFLCGRH
jgi:pimeloyl-ACP methyl ester carboxylesterase